MSSRSRPTTIRIFLADGSPEGLRIIEKSNWTGRGFDFARAEWTKVRTRVDFAKPGVYVLVGPADDGGTVVYIGEADELRARLNMHHASLDFWTRAIAFVSKDENLNKAGVRYLESMLVSLASSAKRAEIRNGNMPSRPFLSEADEAEAAGFLDEMLPIYPILGLTAFENVVAKAAAGDSPRLVLQGPNAQASGRDTAEGFIVDEGSRGRATETSSLPAYVRAIRKRMVADKIFEVSGDSFRLTKDWIFSSPSTAAMAMLGRPANGRTEWADESGRTLKGIQEEAAS